MFATANPSGGGFDVRCLRFDVRCLMFDVKMRVEVLDKKSEISFARNRPVQ
jgi:hypothetical protein